MASPSVWLSVLPLSAHLAVVLASSFSAAAAGFQATAGVRSPDCVATMPPRLGTLEATGLSRVCSRLAITLGRWADCGCEPERRFARSAREPRMRCNTKKGDMPIEAISGETFAAKLPASPTLPVHTSSHAWHARDASVPSSSAGRKSSSVSRCAARSKRGALKRSASRMLASAKSALHTLVAAEVACLTITSFGFVGYLDSFASPVCA